MNLEYAICGDEEGNELTLLDIVPDECNIENDFIEKLDIENMKAAINKLPDKYRKVIELHLQGATERQIGEQMNISQSYANRIRHGAVYKLRKLMKGRDCMNEKTELHKERVESNIFQVSPENKPLPVENRPILQVIKFGGRVGEYFIKGDSVEITLKENQSVVKVPKKFLKSFIQEIAELEVRI